MNGDKWCMSGNGLDRALDAGTEGVTSREQFEPYNTSRGPFVHIDLQSTSPFPIALSLAFCDSYIATLRSVWVSTQLPDTLRPPFSKPLQLQYMRYIYNRAHDWRFAQPSP